MVRATSKNISITGNEVLRRMGIPTGSSLTTSGMVRVREHRHLEQLPEIVPRPTGSPSIHGNGAHRQQHGDQGRVCTDQCHAGSRPMRRSSTTPPGGCRQERTSELGRVGQQETIRTHGSGPAACRAPTVSNSGSAAGSSDVAAAMMTRREATVEQHRTRSGSISATAIRREVPLQGAAVTGTKAATLSHVDFAERDTLVPDRL